MQAMTITMPPIQIACQSSLPQNAGTVLPFSICRKISIMFYYFAKIRQLAVSAKLYLLIF